MGHTYCGNWTQPVKEIALSKERQKPLRVGASKGEVGRVSQEGKVAQARKDSGDR
jgi:hypothetical protein